MIWSGTASHHGEARALIQRTKKMIKDLRKVACSKKGPIAGQSAGKRRGNYCAAWLPAMSRPKQLTRMTAATRRPTRAVQRLGTGLETVAVGSVIVSEE